MSDDIRMTGKQIGLGVVNLLVAVLLIAAAVVTLHGRAGKMTGQIVVTVLVAAVYVVGGRWIERRTITEFSRPGGAKEVVAGLALGGLLFATVVAVLWMAGVYHFSGWGTARAIPAGLVLAACAGIQEEILFRGFLFRLLSGAAGTWVALVVTSAFFGLAHAANPGATVASSLAIALEAGVLLGAAYALTCRLWFPIGLHMGWNFTEGWIFGMSVSGFATAPAPIMGTLGGRPLLTGGGFGPEASVVAVGVCLCAAMALLVAVVRTGRVERPLWSRLRATANAAKVG